MVADGNEIFELHLAQLNMIHQMEKLKEKMKCE